MEALEALGGGRGWDRELREREEPGLGSGTLPIGGGSPLKKKRSEHPVL